MPESRTRYRSAFRGQRTDKDQPDVPGVPSPVGPNHMTAGAQADLLRRATGNELMGYLPLQMQRNVNSGYQLGGFDGVVAQTGPQWYDLPEWARTKILAGKTGTGGLQ